MLQSNQARTTFVPGFLMSRVRCRLIALFTVGPTNDQQFEKRGNFTMCHTFVGSEYRCLMFVGAKVPLANHAGSTSESRSSVQSIGFCSRSKQVCAILIKHADVVKYAESDHGVPGMREGEGWALKTLTIM